MAGTTGYAAVRAVALTGASFGYNLAKRVTIVVEATKSETATTDASAFDILREVVKYVPRNRRLTFERLGDAVFVGHSGCPEREEVQPGPFSHTNTVDRFRRPAPSPARLLLPSHAATPSSARRRKSRVGRGPSTATS